MPKYVGEGYRELYWQRNGKWFHGLSNGKSFDTLEDAKQDYAANHSGLGIAGVIAILIFLFGVFCMTIAFIG